MFTNNQNKYRAKIKKKENKIHNTLLIRYNNKFRTQL